MPEKFGIEIWTAYVPPRENPEDHWEPLMLNTLTPKTWPTVKDAFGYMEQMSRQNQSLKLRLCEVYDD